MEQNINPSLKREETLINKNSVSDTKTEENSQIKKLKFDKYVYTFLLCYTNLTYGISLKCISLALLDFICILDIEAKYVTHYYLWFSVGAIIGSLVGFIFKYVNRQLVLVISIMLYGVVTAVMPVSPHFIVFYIFGFIGGMSAAIIDIVQTIWLIEMWVLKSGSVLQLSGFSFGVGLIIGPVVVNPFVFSDSDCTEPDFMENTTYTMSYYSHKLIPPFLTSGALQVFGGLLLLIMFLTHRYFPDQKVENKINNNEIEEVFTISNVSSTFLQRTIIALGAICFATAIASEVAYLKLSPSFFYVYGNMKTSKTEVLLTAMIASYTINRGLNIFLAIRVRPQYIMIFYYLVLYSAISLLFFAHKSETIVWIGNILFGLGISPFWSAILSYYGRHFEITNNVVAIYVLIWRIIDMVTYFIDESFFESNPEVLLYYCLITITLSLISFILTKILFRYKGNPK